MKTRGIDVKRMLDQRLEVGFLPTLRVQAGSCFKSEDCTGLRSEDDVIFVGESNRRSVLGV